MKTAKALLTAAVLAAAPTFAMAECSGYKHQAAMSCANGTVWDADTRSCVTPVSS